MGALSSINIRFKVDLAEFSTQMQNVSREVKKASDSLKSVGNSLSTYVTLPIVAAGGAAVKFASDYEESLNKVNVAFGESGSYVKAWAKESLDSFGIAEGTALDMASLFGDMATSMGIPQKEAAKMSTVLTGLAGDLASFKNIGIDQATTALNGVFTGETESLKRIGVVMTEANLQAFALSNGIKKQVKDMSEAEKVNLRYAYVLEKTKNAQGDFERTGGGAANQMRIFQESLKQVAQQLGAVILPVFTKVISFVNEKIKAFSNLSEGTKTLIVGFGAVAAAIGPVLSGFGSLLGVIPNIVSSVSKIGAQWTSLTTLLAANPFTAVITAVAALATTFVVAESRFTDLADANRDFNKVMQEGAASVAKEKAELEKNLAIAKNKNIDLNTRKEAIKNINAISPEFLGNINLENLYTKQTTDSLKKYNEQLIKRAQLKAAEEKLIQVQKQLLDLQMGNLEQVKPDVWQTLGNAFKAVTHANGGFNVVQAYSLEKLKTTAVNAKTQTAELTKLQQMLIKLIGTNTSAGQSSEQFALGLDSVTKSAENVEKKFKEGTVAYFENLKSKLEEQQKTIPVTNAAWLTYEERIDAVQKKIDALTNKELKLPEPPKFDVGEAPEFLVVDEAKTLEQLNALKSVQEQMRSEFSETSEQYRLFSERINETQLKINEIEGKDEVVETLQTLSDAEQKYNEERIARMQALNEAYNTIGQSLLDVFGSYTQGFIDSLGIANEGMKSFVSSIVGTITKLISMALSASLANSIQGATQSGAATGPGAVFTTPAFIATAIAGVISAFAAIPKFETGGIIGGSSYYGDRILARVNSGELILNQKQQQAVYGMLSQSNSEQNINLVGGFKISGSDIELVIDRAIAKNKRTR